MSPNELLNIPDSKIMYNAQGEPEFVLVPIKPSKTYDIAEEDIVAAIDELREELTDQYNAGTSTVAD